MASDLIKVLEQVGREKGVERDKMLKYGGFKRSWDDNG